MSRTKEYLQAYVHDLRRTLDRALDRAESHLDPELIAPTLLEHGQLGMEVFGLLLENLDTAVQGDPENFLTCDVHFLREYAKGIIDA